MLIALLELKNKSNRNSTLQEAYSAITHYEFCLRTSKFIKFLKSLFITESLVHFKFENYTTHNYEKSRICIPQQVAKQ